MSIASTVTDLLFAPIDRFVGWSLGLGFNSNLGHAPVQLCRLLHEAESDVQIVAGRLERGLFSEPKVLAEFQNAVGREVSIQVICASEVDEESKPFRDLAASSGENLEIRQAQGYPPAHYIVVDRSKVFVEEYHPPRSSKRRGVILKDANLVAPRLALDFGRWWKELTPNGNKSGGE